MLPGLQLFPPLAKPASLRVWPPPCRRLQGGKAGPSALQDFALEADESRMRNGAHLMAGSLSGSLALVTGREPLRHSLTSQLRLMLANMLDPPTLESTIAVSLLHGTPTSRTRHGPSCCKGGSQ